MTGLEPCAAAVFSQLQRSSLSVQLNIAEGYANGASRSFTRHLNLLHRNRRSQQLLPGMLRWGQKVSPLTAHARPGPAQAGLVHG